MSSRFYEQLYASTDNRKENAIERVRSTVYTGTNEITYGRQDIADVNEREH